MTEHCTELRATAALLPAVPDLRQPEIADGMIHLPFVPGAHHRGTADLIHRQLAAQLPDPDQVCTDAVLEDPLLGVLRRPDLTVRRADAPHATMLVGEIVSPRAPETDHRSRADDYTAMGIPLHLLVDPRKGTGIVHDEPGCTRRTDFAFGDVITVGPWTLDTGALRTYAAQAAGGWKRTAAPTPGVT